MNCSFTKLGDQSNDLIKIFIARALTSLLHLLGWLFGYLILRFPTMKRTVWSNETSLDL